jgi:hypothetical protein
VARGLDPAKVVSVNGSAARAAKCPQQLRVSEQANWWSVRGHEPQQVRFAPCLGWCGIQLL